VILIHPSAGAAFGGMDVYLEKTHLCTRGRFYCATFPALKKPLLGSYSAGAGSTLRSLARAF
jgi:hypothetical protein